MTTPDTKWIEEAQTRCEMATPGPWRFVIRKKGDNDLGVMLAAVAPGHQIVYDAPGGCYPARDGAFIAHARTDLPRALAVCAALEKWRQRLVDRPDATGLTVLGIDAALRGEEPAK